MTDDEAADHLLAAAASDVHSHEVLVGLVRRLIEIDDRRMAVVVATQYEDIGAGVEATLPIMAEYRGVMNALRLAVGLGVEATEAGTPSVGDRATCRWCHQPITFTSSSELVVDEDSWTHDWPQPGSGYVRRRKCEADMQSMVAEP